MKAISLWQPWGTLWAHQAKQYETRSWKTNYTGPLAIHAAMHNSPEISELCRREPFKSVLSKLGYENFITLPRGVILAVCDGVECYEIVTPKGGMLPQTPVLFKSKGNIEVVSIQERAFGDFTGGRFAWKPINMRLLPTPVICSGAQSIWEVPEFAAEAIEKQLRKL